MSFRLVEKKTDDPNQKFLSCKDFFKKIRNEVDSSSPIKFDMDNFMLCLIVGLKHDKKESLNNYKFQPPFSPKYIETYLKIKPLITGLLLFKTMKIKNIDKNEKDKVKKNLQEVLDTNYLIDLKREYIDLMHEYYLGGYCFLLKQFNNKAPDEVSIFFYKYNKLVGN